MQLSRRNKEPVLFAFVLMSVVLSAGLLAADLTVYGEIESQNGGFVFPDGSIQVTAAGGDVPIAASGEWDFAGMIISPRMILHDLIFYVESDNAPPCQFTMNYVLSQIESRTIREFSLYLGQSVELHFGAGIDTSNLRFGTIGGGTCVRHWMATGFAVQ